MMSEINRYIDIYVEPLLSERASQKTSMGLGIQLPAIPVDTRKPCWAYKPAYIHVANVTTFSNFISAKFLLDIHDNRAFNSCQNQIMGKSFSKAH